ncbi:peptide chain release factor N(5)-glutamine methyltransferase [Flavobacterium sp.]|uniref:peptide chain release factor N(5)-glutamine methyltransferase n=1 Tax=Flavobacterium sp. TaxID=239 RepID=UPI0038D01A94
MLLKTFKSKMLTALSSIYDEQEIESFFYLLLESYQGKKCIDLALNPDMEMDALQLIQWESALSELLNQKPIQYIIGATEFYGLPFMVNENTLIPRPETEELVEWIVAESRESAPGSLKILDIGTGCGCIAISLAKNLPNAEVFAVDVSEKALAVAKKNADTNKVKVNFIQADILKINDLVELSTHFDIIVSNPPYVRHLEKAEIKPNVLEYEPHLALFVEDSDALLFYRKIAELANQNLVEKGKLFFEINQYLGKETLQLLEKFGFNSTELKKDIYGNDRMTRSEK